MNGARRKSQNSVRPKSPYKKAHKAKKPVKPYGLGLAHKPWKYIKKFKKISNNPNTKSYNKVKDTKNIILITIIKK